MKKLYEEYSNEIHIIAGVLIVLILIGMLF